MAQMRWKDVGPIEIAHSSEPMGTYMLTRFRIGVEAFESNDGPGLPNAMAIITDFCGRWEMILRCGRESCAECESTMEWKRGGWVRRVWERVVRRRG